MNTAATVAADRVPPGNTPPELSYDAPGDLGDYFVGDILAHGLEIVVAGLVHGEAEGGNAASLRFQQGHLGVMQRVFLLHPVAAVAVVLGPAI